VKGEASFFFTFFRLMHCCGILYEYTWNDSHGFQGTKNTECSEGCKISQIDSHCHVAEKSIKGKYYLKDKGNTFRILWKRHNSEIEFIYLL
jgi:hypothetical protein